MASCLSLNSTTLSIYHVLTLKRHRPHSAIIVARLVLHSERETTPLLLLIVRDLCFTLPL